MPPEPLRVLIVDDDEAHAEAVAESLERSGYACSVATSGTEGLERIETQDYDVLITDLVMDAVNGIDLLKAAKRALSDVEVILISGHGTITQAVTAMHEGALTYLTKPLDIDELRAVIAKAGERLQLARSNRELQSQLNERFGFEGVVGNSPQMQHIISTLRQIAPTSATVLIQGETGTGKELVARAIHVNSPRKNKPFKAINCAAFSDMLIESELFGHEKGAFTGADRQRQGTFEYANGGTLFLDELGDMPMSTQIKLLRVIESGEIVRVGSNEPVKVNVRLISATNQDLEQAIAKGSFRKELYYRLKVATIRLPPLRQRREDIPLLADYFVKQLQEVHEKGIVEMSKAARRAIMTFDWPGNVRQLRNVLETMIVVDSDGVLDMDDLRETDISFEAADTQHSETESSLIGKPLEEVERFYIQEALKLSGGNREEAAKMLVIGERTMYRKIKRFALGGKNE